MTQYLTSNMVTEAIYLASGKYELHLDTTNLRIDTQEVNLYDGKMWDAILIIVFFGQVFILFTTQTLKLK